MKTKKRFRIFLVVILCFGILGCTTVFGVNIYVKGSVADRMISSEEAAKLTEVDCILVLGCQVKDDGKPSDMLKDRLTRSIEVYNLGAAPKVLMSGDHGREEYDEVGAMKEYAVKVGVPSEVIFKDHAGFSTYESLYRAKEIFQVDKLIVITQEYHLYRALYIAEQLGIEAYGVASDYHTYAGQGMRDFREVLARCKDVVMCIFKPEPTYLGDPVPITGSGDFEDK